MSDVFQERTFAHGRTLEDVTAAAKSPGSCFHLYRVEHRASFLSKDGKMLICWFAAPDAEALRNAFRRMETDSSGVWSGASHATSGVTRAKLLAGNVLIERTFAQPMTLAAIEAQQEAAAPSLARHGVEILIAFLSRDGKRSLSVLSANDLNSLPARLREANLAFDRTWMVHTIGSARSTWPDA